MPLPSSQGGKLLRERSNYGRTNKELLYENMANAGFIRSMSLEFHEDGFDWALQISQATCIDQ